MKFLLCFAFISTNLFAAERVLISDSKWTNVELNQSSVRCSSVGYALPELKVAIKELSGWTLFDHSNANAGDALGLPCMTAGLCKPFGSSPSVEDILYGGFRTERIKINRQIVEVKEVNKDESGNDICLRHVEERLETRINRGNGWGNIKFNHTRSGIHEIFPISICQ